MSDKEGALKCSVCDRLVPKEEIIEGGDACLECFVSGNVSKPKPQENPASSQKSVSQPPEERKEAKSSDKVEQAPTICIICKTTLNPSEVVEGAEGYCIQCFLANESEISKAANPDEPENPLVDPNFVNYLIFNLFQDEEAPTEERYYYSKYLHIDKRDPSNVEVLDLYSSQTALSAIIANSFSSITSLSPYQYLLTGGCVGDPSNRLVPSSLCVAVVLRKHDQYFNFIPFQSLLSARYGHASVILDDHLYVLGGLQKTTKENTYCWLNRCERLSLSGLKSYLDVITGGYSADMPTNSWEEIEKMSQPRANLSAFGHANKIYAFGGFSGPNTLESSIERYDVTQKKWENINLDEKLQQINYKFLASSVLLRVEDKIYILGGSNGQNESKDTVEIDAETLEITSLKPLNRGRAAAQGFVAQGTLYIFGGENSPFTVETLKLKEKDKGFVSVGPIEDVDNGTGLLGRGFIGDSGFFIQ